jgi:hypothetical protein
MTSFLRLTPLIISRTIIVETELLQKLGNKKISKAQLFQLVEEDFGLLPTVWAGVRSSKAVARYGCGSVLVNLAEKHPDKLYPYIDRFIELLDSKHRILTWNALAAIANLTAVDAERKFDAIFDKYYSFLRNEYMVTVANVVVNSAKIAINKPYLADRITAELLKVQNLKVTPHLTDECKLVIAEQAIKTFGALAKYTQNKKALIDFAKNYQNSSRASLQKEAQKFLQTTRMV